MSELIANFAAFEKRLVEWGTQREDVRAMIVLGSRARTDRPADEWSDMDVLLLVNAPEQFITTTDWLSALGKVWITYLEPTTTGDRTERRVLFDGGVDVDFVPVPAAGILEMLASGTLAASFMDVARRGIRFLVDKDGLADRLPPIPASSAAPRQPPDETAFLNVVNDFWYHVVWTAKKLRRGELWTALGSLNCYMRWNCLLPLLEWHALAVYGADHNVWFNGRFLEQWADSAAIDALSGVFAHYDEQDSWNALQDLMALFRRLATETAAHFNFDYPEAGDRYVSEWIQQHKPGG